MKDHRTESQRWTDEPWTLYTEIKRDRNRLRAWLRWWNNGARDEHLFYMLSMNELRECIAGKPAPRARKVRP
jgi:hypothetical protein